MYVKTLEISNMIFIVLSAGCRRDAVEDALAGVGPLMSFKFFMSQITVVLCVCVCVCIFVFEYWR
jgi:hypothetical protein